MGWGEGGIQGNKIIRQWKFHILSGRQKPIEAFDEWHDVENTGVRIKEYQAQIYFLVHVRKGIWDLLDHKEQLWRPQTFS